MFDPHRVGPQPGPHPEVSPSDALKIAADLLQSIPPWRPFPTEHMPRVPGEYAADVAAGLGVDPAMVAVPLLSALGGIAGTKVRLNMDPNAAKTWMVRPIFWTCVIANSGTNKSAAWEAADDVAMVVEKSMQTENELAHDRYESDLQAWKDEEPDHRGPKPKEPALKQLLVDDTTVEAISSILADNPSGCILSTDELRNWFDTFARYRKAGGGSDATRWLPFHSGKRFIVNRKGKDGSKGTRLYIPHAAVGVMGTTQPRILAKIVGDEERDSGFLARLLLVMPPGRPRLWRPVKSARKTDSRLVIEELAMKLYRTPEREVTLAPESVDLFMSWQHPWSCNSFKKWAAEIAALRAKLEEVALRVALLYFLCDHAWENQPPPTVGASYVAAGIATARWFHDEALRVYATFVPSGPTTQRCRDAITWAREKTAPGCPLEGGFTARDIQRAKLQETAEAAQALCNQMLEAGLISEVPQEPRKGRGQKPLTKYIPTPARQIDRIDDDDTTREPGMD